jgi:hypothetical protein
VTRHLFGCERATLHLPSGATVSGDGALTVDDPGNGPGRVSWPSDGHVEVWPPPGSSWSIASGVVDVRGDVGRALTFTDSTAGGPAWSGDA